MSITGAFFIKNPKYFDAVLIEAPFEIIFWDVPENVCEF